MASREEVLIGFQVIRKINQGNAATYNSAYYLMRELPFVGEPLLIPDEAGENPREPTIEDVITLTSTANKIANKQIKNLLEAFLQRFNDKKAIKRGVEHFNVSYDSVLRDKEEVLFHTPNVKCVVELLDDFASLHDNGALLSLYDEAVDLYIHPEVHLSKQHQIVNMFQDILNATALELQGICSYNGNLRYPNVESRIPLVESRLRVADKMKKQLPDTQETRSMKRALHTVWESLLDVKEKDDLNNLGIWLAQAIPQLPLIRRHWNIS